MRWMFLILIILFVFMVPSCRRQETLVTDTISPSSQTESVTGYTDMTRADETLHGSETTADSSATKPVYPPGTASPTSDPEGNQTTASLFETPSPAVPSPTKPGYPSGSAMPTDVPASNQTTRSSAATPTPAIPSTSSVYPSGAASPPATPTTRPTPKPTARPTPVPTAKPSPTPTDRPATIPAATVAPAPTLTPVPGTVLDYKQEMRLFVQNISRYAKQKKPGFLVIPQNGEDIIEASVSQRQAYLAAVDGIGREDFLYGGQADNQATPDSWTRYIKKYLDQFQDAGKPVLITDYCSTRSYVDDSYTRNNSYGYISLAADSRELDRIPAYPAQPYDQQAKAITKLSEANNFLYLINPWRFASKADMVSTLRKTNYDVFILDLFVSGVSLTKEEVASLQIKPDGNRRLVLAYMSIGEAETYRFYWQSSWTNQPPDWLLDENPDWPGNFKVRYWHPDWQALIYGSASSYADRIITAGFDGVYLDLIDAYEYFETD